MANEIPAGLTLLKDWSTWLVSLQTGALGLVSFVAGKNDVFSFNQPRLKRSICSFAASIFFATWVLGAIPSIAMRLKPSENFYNLPMFEWFPVHLWVFTTFQHWCFLFGLFFFVRAIAKKA